ncbi:MAG: hypothetical protein V1743_05340 [Nanoarchaeota archaeon]
MTRKRSGKSDSRYLQVFGSTQKQRVLDFLTAARSRDIDYSMTEIASLSGVGYSSLKLFWNDLVTCGLVRQTRTVGKAKMYVLNDANPVVRQFLALQRLTNRRR